jgi:hypothetical protein
MPLEGQDSRTMVRIACRLREEGALPDRET